MDRARSNGDLGESARSDFQKSLYSNAGMSELPKVPKTFNNTATSSVGVLIKDFEKAERNFDPVSMDRTPAETALDRYMKEMGHKYRTDLNG